MGIVVNWEKTVNSVLDGITDYETVELTDAEYSELYQKAENNLDGYGNVDSADVEGVINVFLRSKGYSYNDNHFIWEKPLDKKQNEMVSDKMSSNVKTNMCFVANNLEAAKKEIIEFVSSFDGDISGENGEEYTFPEALERGYTSTIEYLVNESEAKNTENLINDVLSTVVQTYESYDGAGFDLIFDSANDQFAIAFTYC